MVNVNHMDKYLKEILVFVYYGSIVNNRPKNEPHKKHRRNKLLC